MKAPRSDAILTLPARPARWVAGGAILALAVWFLHGSLALQRLPGTDKVGPGAFPGLAALILAGGALALLTGLGERKAEPVTVERPANVLLALAALVGFVLLLDKAPILLAIPAFTVLLQLTFGERRWAPLLLGAAGLTGAVWLLFGVLLRVPL